MKTIVALAVLLSASTALAQTADEKAAALALFEDGKRLLKDGKIAEACAKFEGSLEVVNQLGTRLNLADCYEQDGRTASAWLAFREAAVAAEKAGDDRGEFARERMAGLEARVPHLTISVAADADVDGLEVTRDGERVVAALLGTSVPIDPGEHEIKATATGREPWSETITVGEGESASVEVPMLMAAEWIEYEEPPVADQPSDPGRGRRLAAYVVGGAGIAALGVGTVFALSARSTWNDAHDSGHCDSRTACDDEGFALVEDARSSGNIATVVTIVGLAAVGAGVVLYVTAPSAPSRETTVRVTPAIGGDTIGLTLSGGF